MWLSSKKLDEIHAELDALKKRVQYILDENIKLKQSESLLQSENESLKRAIVLKDAKIKDQMEGLQALNRDLDEWEPLANLIVRIPVPLGDEMKTPTRGIKLLERVYGKG